MNKSAYKIIYIILAIALLVYVFARAYYLSLTCDESSTFNVLDAANGVDLFYKKEWFTSANNHVLNSILLRWSVGLFGIKEWVLRLPNVIAYGLYLISCTFMLKSITPNWGWRILGLLSLSASHYFIDFFSVARGYGLAAALATAALCIYICSEHSKKRWVIYALFMLAVFANYTYINYMLAFLIVDNVFIFIVEKSKKFTIRETLKHNLPSIIIFFATALSCYTAISYLLQIAEFKYGASTLLQSFNSYIETFIYNRNNILIPYNWKQFGLALFIPISMFSAIYTLVETSSIHKTSKVWKLLFLTCSELITMLLLSFLQRNILGTMYFDERKATIFTPLLFIIWVCTAIIWSYNKRLLKKIALPFILVLFVANMLQDINIRVVREWWYDAGSKAMVSVIPTSDKPARILLEWPFYWSVHMYNKYFYKNTFSKIATNRDYYISDTSFDYCYFTGENTKQVHPIYRPFARLTYDGILLKKNYAYYNLQRDSLKALNVTCNVDSILGSIRKAQRWEDWLPYKKN